MGWGANSLLSEMFPAHSAWSSKNPCVQWPTHLWFLSPLVSITAFVGGPDRIGIPSYLSLLQGTEGAFLNVFSMMSTLLVPGPSLESLWFNK